MYISVNFISNLPSPSNTMAASIQPVQARAATLPADLVSRLSDDDAVSMVSEGWQFKVFDIAKLARDKGMGLYPAREFVRTAFQRTYGTSQIDVHGKTFLIVGYVPNGNDNGSLPANLDSYVVTTSASHPTKS